MQATAAQEILIATGLQLTPDQKKQLLSACEHPLVAGCSPPSAFISEPFAAAPPPEPAPHSALGPQTLNGSPRSMRMSLFTAGAQQPAGAQALAGFPSYGLRASIFAPGVQQPAGAPAFMGAPSRSYRASMYSFEGPGLLAPALYQRTPSTPRRMNRASIAPGATGGFLALSRTVSNTAPPPLAPHEAAAPISSEADRAGSVESAASGAGSAGVAPLPGRGSVTWGGVRASPSVGFGLGFGLAPPVEAPRMALSLPHLLLAPVLEAALISRRAARLARLRSSGAVKLPPERMRAGTSALK